MPIDPRNEEELKAATWGELLEVHGLHLSEIELAAAGFREALHHQRGEDALRGLLGVGRHADWSAASTSSGYRQYPAAPAWQVVP